MNDKPSNNTASSSMAPVLTTLASTGDNLVKVLIVGGLILNGYLTSKNGSDTRKDMDKVQQAAAKQIRVIFTNQSIWAQYAEATEVEHRMMLEKLGVPKDQWPRLPPINFEKLNDEEEDNNNDNNTP